MPQNDIYIFHMNEVCVCASVKIKQTKKKSSGEVNECCHNKLSAPVLSRSTTFPNLLQVIIICYEFQQNSMKLFCDNCFHVNKNDIHLMHVFLHTHLCVQHRNIYTTIQYHWVINSYCSRYFV